MPEQAKNKENTEKIIKMLEEIKQLLEIKGENVFKIRAYQKAIVSLENLNQDISLIYEKGGIKGLDKIPSIGEGIAKKIAEYLEKGKLKYYEDLKKETAVRQIITYFFETKGIDLQNLKKQAKKKSIIYARYTKPAKELLQLSDYSINKSKKSIKRVAEWAQTRNLDYTIDTVIKRWLELDKLKPKKPKEEPFYDNKRMVWSKPKKKWFVIDDDGQWLEFADKESKIEWRIIK